MKGKNFQISPKNLAMGQAVYKLQIQKLLAFLVWVMYQIGRLSLGLVVHPYRSVREIMRGEWFAPLIFLPTGILVWIFVSGRIAAWVIDVPSGYRDAIGLAYSTFVISLGLWQILLIYLGVRFGRGLRR